MANKRKLTMALQALYLTAGLTLTNSLEVQPAIAQSSAVQAGYSFLERGWVDDAIQQFQQAVQQQPQSVAARLGLAVAYQRAGRDSEAWQAYQQVLSLEANNQPALTAIGQLGSYRPEWQAQGILALTQLLQINPDDSAAQAQRALLLGYQGRFAEAIADYERLLSNRPAPATILAAAQIYTYSGNYRQGLALFEQYLATGQPLSAAGATAYAQTLQQAGRPSEAIALLTQRLQSAPDDLELRSALAVAYQSNQQTEAALNTLAPLRDRPDARLPLARSLSQIARQAGETALYREAVLLYQQALVATANPSPGLVTEVADVFSEDPDFQATALQIYDQLLTASPYQPALQTKRLILAAELGELTPLELRSQLLSLLQPLPDDATLRQQIGQALIRLDHRDPALLPIYQDLIAAATPVDFLYFRLAQIEMAQGNWSAASAAIAAYQATPAGQQDLAAGLLLAELERQQGNLAASAQQYEAILSQSQSPQMIETALLGLSGIRQSQQRWEAALAAYEQILSRNPQSERGRLGQTYLALKLERLSVAAAETVLHDWLAAHPRLTPAEVSFELLDLVGALPPDAKRQTLYETLLAIAPDHIGVNRRYVQWLAQTDKAQALAYVQQLTQAEATPVGLYFVQGEVAQTLGELTLASQAYEAVLTQQPENTDALSALAGVRFQQRRLRQAETLYEQVLALKPQDWETRRILAELKLAQDQPIAALQQFSDLQGAEEASSLEQPPAHRIQHIEINFLRRRGFQPFWERY
ncbi:tetratricopeptide repeat protein [Almyronema epifaneia]|uniref:Tetratricopeptide repeat protein n=1 Tax=Almyronema epifaneia S1 TaxID=2991925 RepID=A0ABW6IB81_9CYAN